MKRDTFCLDSLIQSTSTNIRGLLLIHASCNTVIYNTIPKLWGAASHPAMLHHILQCCITSCNAASYNIELNGVPMPDDRPEQAES